MTEQPNGLTYAEMMKQAAEQSAKAHEVKKAPEAAERRAQAVAEKWNKGVQFFKDGINSAREKMSGVGKFAKEAGKMALATPELAQDLINSGVDKVKHVAAEGALKIDKANDWCADRWDSMTAKGTGAVESGWRKVAATATEGGAKFAKWRQEANDRRAEKGHVILRTALEATRALVKKMELSLEGKQMDDLTRAQEWDESRTEMTGMAGELRQEADKRKDNGKSLMGLRSAISSTIAPTRFN